MSVTFGSKSITGDTPQKELLVLWRRQFEGLWQSLHCDCGGALHHAKTIVRIEARMNDSEYCERHEVSSEDRTEAHRTIERHLEAKQRRIERLREAVVMFPEFWRNRPTGSDEFLREWFQYATETDDVLFVMPEIDPEHVDVWSEVGEVISGRTGVG